jgi:hypothetical protein
MTGSMRIRGHGRKNAFKSPRGLFSSSCVRALVEKINKKNKNANVKPFMVKNHLWIFLNCSIENPAFDSQVLSACGALWGFILTRGESADLPGASSPNPRDDDSLRPKRT